MSRFYTELLRIVALVSVAAIAAGQPQATTICALIDSRLPGRIIYPSSSVYNSSLSSYYSGQERELKPGCIFTPIHTAEVSRFVKLINANGNNGNSTPQFAIRGGGHTLFSGAANINGGITVDMRSMNSLALNEDHKVASIGGGAVWSDIYPQIVPYNLTVMGGRISGIAIGGFSTGGKYSNADLLVVESAHSTSGGINFLSRREGWSCDNIHGYEVVIASGAIIYATASSYPDLWLALKGGSNNYGIITRFDVATFPQGPMWGGVIAFNYTRSVLDAQAKAFSNFMDPKNFDDAADMGIILGFHNGTFAVANSLFYTEPMANPPVFQPFTSIPSLVPNTLALNTVSDVVTQFGRLLPPQATRYGFLTELIFINHTNLMASQRYRICLFLQELRCISLLPTHPDMGGQHQIAIKHTRAATSISYSTATCLKRHKFTWCRARGNRRGDVSHYSCLRQRGR